MAYTLIQIIDILANVVFFTIFINFILQFFLPPHHQIRVMLDGIIRPLLDPIRRIIPSTGGLDFSPIILWILIVLTRSVLINIIVSVN